MESEAHDVVTRDNRSAELHKSIVHTRTADTKSVTYGIGHGFDDPVSWPSAGNFFG